MIQMLKHCELKDLTRPDFINYKGQLHCGFPGRPQNGIVNITLHSSKAVAKYECPGSFIIDGDPERTCGEDGTWTGTIPRCGSQFNYVLHKKNNILKILLDKFSLI
jgi:Sushi repeat (SCR repeat)